MNAIHDIAAPAKLNLFLHVTGRRADGYHLLQSLFVLIDWCDTLHVERRADGRLARHDLGPALPADDLCLRAARLLQTESGCGFGADISIEKSVPWGAGMGGGSSDAASTLLALNRLWGLHWPRARLAELGLRLGADVPFFIGGRNAIVEGIGERLTPAPVAPQWLAVLKPDVSIETRAILPARCWFAIPNLLYLKASLRTPNRPLYSPDSGGTTCRPQRRQNARKWVRRRRYCSSSSATAA